MMFYGASTAKIKCVNVLSCLQKVLTLAGLLTWVKTFCYYSIFRMSEDNSTPICSLQIVSKSESNTTSDWLTLEVVLISQ